METTQDSSHKAFSSLSPPLKTPITFFAHSLLVKKNNTNLRLIAKGWKIVVEKYGLSCDFFSPETFLIFFLHIQKKKMTCRPVFLSPWSFHNTTTSHPEASLRIFTCFFFFGKNLKPQTFFYWDDSISCERVIYFNFYRRMSSLLRVELMFLIILTWKGSFTVQVVFAFRFYLMSSNKFSFNAKRGVIN